MPAFIDISGTILNGWRVSKYLGREKWECYCPRCQSMVVKRKCDIEANQTCQACRKFSKVKHGHSKAGVVTDTYSVWSSMRERCLSPSSPSFHHYGGRGITIYQRWEDYVNFLTDMGVKPNGKSIDRIDNNGNYEPSNCRWATPMEQARNRRTNHVVSYNGEIMTLVEFSRKVGVFPGNISRMLRKNGWSFNAVPSLKRVPHAHGKRFVPCK